MSRLASRLCLRVVLAMFAMTALSGFGGKATSAERRNAGRLILEKLNRESGEGWQRAGQFFLWTYRFSANGCELSIRREDVEGGREVVKQTVPMADVVPVWQGSGAVTLYCQSTTDCIELSTKGEQPEDTRTLGQTSLVVPVADDLPKLHDAFSELHRLCDDAYRGEP